MPVRQAVRVSNMLSGMRADQAGILASRNRCEVAKVTAVAKGARTREGASTRQAIYEAALDAFSENGYAGASLRDIARRVGIEVASLYNHIDSKEELLFRIIENTSVEMLEELHAAVDAAPPDDPRERLLRATAEEHHISRGPSAE